MEPAEDNAGSVAHLIFGMSYRPVSTVLLITGLCSSFVSLFTSSSTFTAVASKVRMPSPDADVAMPRLLLNCPLGRRSGGLVLGKAHTRQTSGVHKEFVDLKLARFHMR